MSAGGRAPARGGDEQGAPQKQEVRVDGDLLHRTDKPGQVYASSSRTDAQGRPELWPAILEKA